LIHPEEPAMTIVRLIRDMLANKIIALSGIFLVSAVSLMMALIAEYIFGLQPCILCLYQRIPFVLTALIGFAGMITLYKEEWTQYAGLMVFISGLIFFVGGVIAFYHVGVEQHWWRSHLEGCAVDFDADADPAALMELLKNKPAVRCDVIPWVDPVFGLSMAVYNCLMSFGLAAGCTLSAVLIERKKNNLL
jgi:disulfide bond formation protein DsbB